MRKKNKFYINNVIIQSNRIDFTYTIEGQWRKYFHIERNFFLEYSEDIKEVPPCVAVIPLLCNILPIAWVCDAEIIADELDKDFYDSINLFKQGYIDMYPMISFGGKLSVKKIIDVTYTPEDRTALFFSGGVDSFLTLISHVIERPLLLTVWGSDISLKDIEGWKKVKNNLEVISKKFAIDNLSVKSSFRVFLDEGKLNSLISKSQDGWWHGFQHGIGLIGHAAPYVFKHKLKTIYMASTLTENDKGKVTCASDPTINNYVKFCGCKTKYDGYEFTRQDKVCQISQFVKKTGIDITLHVCWVSSGGKNCCRCEKCIRTVFALLAEQENPLKYGFLFNDNDLDQMSYCIRHKYILSHLEIQFWKEIQYAFLNKLDQFKDNPHLSWILTYNFNHTNWDLKKITLRIFSK